MKIIVLGSGVIGTTTAYYLAQAGHDVTVIDLKTNAVTATLPAGRAPWGVVVAP